MSTARHCWTGKRRLSRRVRRSEFRDLFAAYTVSMLGDVVAAVALTVLVFQRTASAVPKAFTSRSR